MGGIYISIYLHINSWGCHIPCIPPLPPASDARASMQICGTGALHLAFNEPHQKKSKISNFICIMILGILSTANKRRYNMDEYSVSQYHITHQQYQYQYKIQFGRPPEEIIYQSWPPMINIQPTYNQTNRRQEDRLVQIKTNQIRFINTQQQMVNLTHVKRNKKNKVRILKGEVGNKWLILLSY